MLIVCAVLVFLICFVADELERRRIDRRVAELKRAWLDGDS